MKKIILYIFTLACLGTSAQEIVKSGTYVDTYYQGEKYFSMRDMAVVFHNSGNAELIIVLDFKQLRSGVDSLDEWLKDLSDTKFIFRGILPSQGDLIELTHHNLKSMEIKGEVEFNGIKHAQIIEMHLFEISKEGLLYLNNQRDYHDRVMAQINFSFLPKNFGIHKKAHHLKKKITVSIGRASLNPLTQELEKYIKN